MARTIGVTYEQPRKPAQPKGRPGGEGGKPAQERKGA